MPLNIPNVGTNIDTLLKGIDTGSNLYATGMHPVLERARQAMEQQRINQSANQFQQELALRQKQFAHSAMNDDLSRQIMMQQLLAAQHANDPMYQFNTFKTIQDKFGGNFDTIKTNPLLRGWFKSQFGIDPVSETPEQKEQRAVDTATKVDEAKSNTKKLDDIEKAAQALLPYAEKVNTLRDIMTRRPDLTGRGTALANFVGLSKDEDVGKFLSASQALQAHMAKDLSRTGGYGVSKLVEQGKPTIGKQPPINVGLISDLGTGMKSSFDQMKEEYERLSGGKKEFPYKYEKYFPSATKSSSKSRLKYNPITGKLE